MLNEYNNNQRVEIKSACAGMLQKSHPKSYFEWCHVNSEYRKNKVDGNPRVLQVMIFGDNNMIVEILPQDVYEEWVGNQWDGAPFDVNSGSGVAYKQGYNQAEKDNELTVEDIVHIIETYNELEFSREYTTVTFNDTCKEVLKRFKEQKDEDTD